MRQLLCCCILLVAPSCFSIEWHVPVFATNLTPSDARHLMFWPADEEGDQWRRSVGTSDIPAFEESLAEAWPLPPIEVEDPIDEIVVFIPSGASTLLRARAEELIVAARKRWPDAATHVQPINLDYPAAVSPRLLYAQLEERAVKRDSDAEGADAVLTQVQYSFSLDTQPKWALVPHEGRDGVLWSTMRSDGFQLELEERGLRAEQALAAVLAQLPEPSSMTLERWVVVLAPVDASRSLLFAIEDLEDGLLAASDDPIAVLRAEASAEWLADLEHMAEAMSPFRWQEVTSGEVFLRGRWRSPGGLMLVWTSGSKILRN